MLSLKDFRRFCEAQGARIEKELLLAGSGTSWAVDLWPNLLAEEAVLVLSSQEYAQ